MAAVYGFVVIIGAWVVMPSERRNTIRNRVHSLLFLLGGVLQARQTRFTQFAGQYASRCLTSWRSLRHATANHRRRTAFVFALLVIPAVGAQLLASRANLEGYEDIPHNIDPVITALLQGERLVPPAPLPPELFVTRELEAERKDIATASREWTMLEAEFRQRLLAVFRLMASHGYQMVLLEGYRSSERQAALAQQGPHVTNAGAFQSYHQFGLAADSAFYRDGRIVISERDPWAMEGYRLYGQYAESVGLTWGGRWKLMDFGHVELRKPNTLARQ